MNHTQGKGEIGRQVGWQERRQVVRQVGWYSFCFAHLKSVGWPYKYLHTMYNQVTGRNLGYNGSNSQFHVGLLRNIFFHTFISKLNLDPKIGCCQLKYCCKQAARFRGLKYNRQNIYFQINIRYHEIRSSFRFGKAEVGQFVVLSLGGDAAISLCLSKSCRYWWSCTAAPTPKINEK